jgi:hypothetical protein
LKYLYCAPIALAAATFVSCGDPVHDDDVTSLGPEDPKVLPGPLHRPGQPCLTCHGGRGPAKAQFSMAGTIYAAQLDANSKPSTLPLSGATVTLVDANAYKSGTVLTMQKGHTETTNAAGNFLVHIDDFTPSYPVHVYVTVGSKSVSMDSHVGRDGSCSGCHHDPAGTESPGHVYFYNTEADIPASQ